MTLTRHNLRLLPLNILFAAGALVWAGCTASAEPAVPAVVTPTTSSAVPANFHASLLTNSFECYGSAGGLYTVEVAIDTDLDDPGNGRLIYQIDGDENGPITGSIPFEGRRYSTVEHVVSTSLCTTVPTIQITEVR